jgi:hypothetical protein
MTTTTHLSSSSFLMDQIGLILKAIVATDPSLPLAPAPAPLPAPKINPPPVHLVCGGSTVEERQERLKRYCRAQRSFKPIPPEDLID